MASENQDAIARQMTASLQAAMVAAEAALGAAYVAQTPDPLDGAECIRLADLAVRGVHVVPWALPGPGVPVCCRCGRTDAWYQWVDSGVVRCACSLPA